MSIRKYKITCIVCPRGCEITVVVENGVIKSITGYTCPMGKKYAVSEITSPLRVLMTVVKCIGGDLPVVSVKTEKPIPKDKLLEASRFLKKIVVKAPVNIGDVIVNDLLGLSVRVIATRPCRRSRE